MTKILSLLRIHSPYYNTTTISAFSCAEVKAQMKHKKENRLNACSESVLESDLGYWQFSVPAMFSEITWYFTQYANINYI